MKCLQQNKCLVYQFFCLLMMEAFHWSICNIYTTCAFYFWSLIPKLAISYLLPFISFQTTVYISILYILFGALKHLPHHETVVAQIVDTDTKCVNTFCLPRTHNTVECSRFYRYFSSLHLEKVQNPGPNWLFIIGYSITELIVLVPPYECGYNQGISANSQATQ